MPFKTSFRAERFSRRAAGRLLTSSFIVGLAAWSLAGQVATLSPLPRSVRGTANFGTQVPIDANEVINFAIVFNVDISGLQTFVDQVSNPDSPLYRQFMTPAEIGQNFGASQADVNSAVSFLQSKGLSVTMIPKSRTAVIAKGTVSQIEAAFGTKMTGVQDAYDGRIFHTNLTPVNVPASLVSKIHSVRGLDSSRPRTRRATTTTLSPALWQIASHDNAAYGFGYKGQGRNVAIANWDGFRLENLTLFYKYYGFPLPPGTQPYTFPPPGDPFPAPTAAQIPTNVTVVPVDNGVGWVGYGSGTTHFEGDLDQQNVLMSVPLCNLHVYDDNAAGTGDSLTPLSTYIQIEEDNWADVVTESYGWATYGIQYKYNSNTGGYTNVAGAYFGAEATEDHVEHLAMSAEGITYMAATGDNGTTAFVHQFTPAGQNASLTTVYSFDYPDIDPEVLQVGGEVVTITTPNGPVVSEASWGQPSKSTTGGTGGFDVYDTPTWDSTSAPKAGNFNYIQYDAPADAFKFNAAPSYQKTYIPTFANAENFRLLPDVSAPAGGGPGLETGPAFYIVYTDPATGFPYGSLAGLWGTSCASPAVAGALASFEQRLFLVTTPNSSRSNVRLGRIADLLYSKGGNTTIFNDITTGSAIGTIPGSSITAKPGKGWDYATGWGSLNFNGLFLSYFDGHNGPHQ